jgi:hypothetical protein
MLNPNSRYLSERLISRLSPLRRANLGRRITERAEEANDAVVYGNLSEKDESQRKAQLKRCWGMLGRLSALTA